MNGKLTLVALHFPLKVVQLISEHDHVAFKAPSLNRFESLQIDEHLEILW